MNKIYGNHLHLKRLPLYLFLLKLWIPMCLLSQCISVLMFIAYNLKTLTSLSVLLQRQHPLFFFLIAKCRHPLMHGTPLLCNFSNVFGSPV